MKISTNTRNTRLNLLAHGACVCLAFSALGSTALAAAEAPDSDDSITIYSRMQAGAVAPELYRPSAGRNYGGQVPGYAIVRHDRSYNLNRGKNALRVTDVAALIDPTTVTFSSLNKPDTRVLEQSFQFDLVSQAKLLQRYLGQRITVEQPRGDNVDLVEGVLLVPVTALPCNSTTVVSRPSEPTATSGFPNCRAA